MQGVLGSVNIDSYEHLLWDSFPQSSLHMEVCLGGIFHGRNFCGGSSPSTKATTP